MKPCIVCIMFFSFYAFLPIFAMTQEERSAMQAGLMGKITYQVLDSDGLPIPDVSVQSSFLVDGHSPTIVSGKTNEEGLFSAESKVNLTVTSTFEKPGYYLGFDKHMFFSHEPNKMSMGKWLPWNPTHIVHLKRKGLPENSVVRRGFKRGLEPARIYGWNMKTGDIVVHDIDGKDLAFLLQFIVHDSIDSHRQSVALRLWSINADGGFSKILQDQTSQLKYPLSIPVDGYDQEIVFSEEVGNGARNTPYLDETNEFLAFKSINTMEDGTADVHFGIFRRLKFGLDNGTIVLDYSYHYNVDSDDRNTEYIE